MFVSSFEAPLHFDRFLSETSFNTICCVFWISILLTKTASFTSSFMVDVPLSP